MYPNVMVEIVDLMRVPYLTVSLTFLAKGIRYSEGAVRPLHWSSLGVAPGHWTAARPHGLCPGASHRPV